jgi:hypothetical protein
MTRADLLAAKRKADTQVISRDVVRLRQPVEYHPVSTHQDYGAAQKKLERSKGNTIYALDDLLRSLK